MTSIGFVKQISSANIPGFPQPNAYARVVPKIKVGIWMDEAIAGELDTAADEFDGNKGDLVGAAVKLFLAAPPEDQGDALKAVMGAKVERFISRRVRTSSTLDEKPKTGDARDGRGRGRRKRRGRERSPATGGAGRWRMKAVIGYAACAAVFLGMCIYAYFNLPSVIADYVNAGPAGAVDMLKHSWLGWAMMGFSVLASIAILIWLALRIFRWRRKPEGFEVIR